MTRVKVHSRLCDHEHVIDGKREGNEIVVSVQSTCDNVKGLSSLRVPVRDILSYGENFVCKRAYESRCTATCLVPTGILLVCWMEADLLSKTLCRKTGPPEIEFCDL